MVRCRDCKNVEQEVSLRGEPVSFIAKCSLTASAVATGYYRKCEFFCSKRENEHPRRRHSDAHIS